MSESAGGVRPGDETGREASPEMSAKPAVSVVLPTFNGARYLEGAVQSVLAQTLTDWELIIVDDCSTDETPDIIARFASRDPRIRAIRHETNRKLPAALNTGFAVVQGAYLTWISDDNLFRPLALASMKAFLDANPDIGLVYTDSTEIDANGREVMYNRVSGFEELIHTNPIGPAFMYRREVHETVGTYDEAMFCAEDYDFWLRASWRFRFGSLHEDLYLYRIHGATLSATQRDRVWDAITRSLEKNLQFLKWATPAQKRRAHLQIAKHALNYGRLGNARHHALRALPATLPWLLRQHRYAVVKLLAGERALALLVRIVTRR